MAIIFATDRSRPKGERKPPKASEIVVWRTVPQPKLRRVGDSIHPEVRRNFQLHAYQLAWELASSAKDGRTVCNAEWDELIRQKLNATKPQARRLKYEISGLGWIETNRGWRHSLVTQDPVSLLSDDPASDEAVDQPVLSYLDSPALAATPVSTEVSESEFEPITSSQTTLPHWVELNLKDIKGYVCSLVAEVAELESRVGALMAENAELKDRLANAKAALD
jgi:hypothetical protein